MFNPFSRQRERLLRHDDSGVTSSPRSRERTEAFRWGMCGDSDRVATLRLLFYLLHREHPAGVHGHW
jgi:hypothetical protein